MGLQKWDGTSKMGLQTWCQKKRQWARNTLVFVSSRYANAFLRYCILNVFFCMLNPRPAGPLDFPPPAGEGAFERPPPIISAPGRRREKRKAAFESSRKIISKSFRSFFVSGQNWGLQGSKFKKFSKRFFDDRIFNFKGRATILIPSCLSR